LKQKSHYNDYLLVIIPKSRERIFFKVCGCDNIDNRNWKTCNQVGKKEMSKRSPTISIQLLKFVQHLDIPFLRCVAVMTLWVKLLHSSCTILWSICGVGECIKIKIRKKGKHKLKSKKMESATNKNMHCLQVIPFLACRLTGGGGAIVLCYLLPFQSFWNMALLPCGLCFWKMAFIGVIKNKT